MSECRQCSDAIRQIRLILGGMDAEDLADEVGSIVNANVTMAHDLAAALARVARLEDALRVYADPRSWRDRMDDYGNPVGDVFENPLAFGEPYEPACAALAATVHNKDAVLEAYRIEVERLTEQRDAAIAVLRSNEWGDDGDRCPECGGWQPGTHSLPDDGHGVNCEWAAILRKAGGE